MASWPAYARIIADGIVAGQDENTRRTTFESGAVRQARARSAALRFWQVSVHLESDTHMGDFRTWAETHGHGAFDGSDPVAGDAIHLRLRGGSGSVTSRGTVKGGRRHWTADMVLEEVL